MKGQPGLPEVLPEMTIRGKDGVRGSVPKAVLARRAAVAGYGSAG